MKKIITVALLAFAVPAFAHAADEAKPAEKSGKKAPMKKGDKADKKDDAAKPADGTK